MSIHTRSNGSVIVRYRENGKQKNRTFGKGEAALKAAEVFNTAVLEKKKRAKNPAFGTIPLKVKYFDELVVIYFQADALNGQKKWKQDWKKMLNKHLLDELGQVPIVNLTQEFIVSLVMAKFPEAGPTTHASYLAYLKAIFNFGIERGYLKENPLRFFKKKTAPQKELLLDLETIQNLKDAAPDHLAFAIELLCNTGVRPGAGELLALKYDHIQWDQGTLRVFGGKTGKWRTIPLKPAFLKKLKNRMKDSKSGYLVEYNGKPVKSVHRSFRRTCEKLKIDKSVVLYDIRHWFCSQLLSNGVPVKSVSTLAGHASSHMTLNVYSHLIPGDTDKAIEHLPDLD